VSARVASDPSVRCAEVHPGRYKVAECTGDRCSAYRASRRIDTISPEKRASNNARARVYVESPETRAKNAAYRATAEARAKANARSRRLRATPEGRAQALLGHPRHLARRGQVAFDLDVEWVAARIREGCAATGLSFDLRAGVGRPPFGPSLDRIVPGGPYTKDNVQVVCWVHNAARGNWGDEATDIYVRARFAAIGGAQ